MDNKPSDQQALVHKAKKSCKIIREAVDKFGRDHIALVWAGDFESILLLHLVKEEFGDIPLSIVHFDDSLRYSPFHIVRDNIVKTWDLDSRVELMEAEDDTAQKHQISLDVMDKYGWEALIIPAITHKSAGRGNTDFLQMDKPGHSAVRPILHFTDADVQTCMDIFGLHESGPDSVETNGREGTGSGYSESGESDQEAEVTRRLRDLGYL